MSVKKRVLFVCTGNTCRSSMAEALARHLASEVGLDGEKVEFASAGVSALPGMRASPQAVAVLAEMNIDLSGHRATLLTPEAVREADLILTMTGAHREIVRMMAPEASDRIYTLAEYAGAGADVPDPYGGTEETYRLCAGELRSMLKSALRRLAEELEAPDGSESDAGSGGGGEGPVREGETGVPETGESGGSGDGDREGGR